MNNKKMLWLFIAALPVLLLPKHAARRLATIIVYAAIAAGVCFFVADNLGIGRVTQITHVADESLIELNGGEGFMKKFFHKFVRIGKDTELEVGDWLLLQGKSTQFEGIPSFEHPQYTVFPKNYGMILDGFKQTLGLKKFFTPEHLTAVLVSACVFCLLMPELMLVATMGTMALLLGGAAFVIHYLLAWSGLVTPHRGLLLSIIVPVCALWGAVLAFRCYYGARDELFRGHQGLVLFFFFRRLAAHVAVVVVLRVLGADENLMSIPFTWQALALLFVSPYLFLVGLALYIPFALGAWNGYEMWQWPRGDLISLVALGLCLLFSVYIHRPDQDDALSEGESRPERRPFWGIKTTHGGRVFLRNLLAVGR